MVCVMWGYSHMLSSSGTVRLVGTNSEPGGLSTWLRIHLTKGRGVVNKVTWHVIRSCDILILTLSVETVGMVVGMATSLPRQQPCWYILPTHTPPHYDKCTHETWGQALVEAVRSVRVWGVWGYDLLWSQYKAAREDSWWAQTHSVSSSATVWGCVGIISGCGHSHLISLALYSTGEMQQRPHQPITTFTQPLVWQLSVRVCVGGVRCGGCKGVYLRTKFFQECGDVNELKEVAIN